MNDFEEWLEYRKKHNTSLENDWMQRFAYCLQNPEEADFQIFSKQELSKRDKKIVKEFVNYFERLPLLDGKPYGKKKLVNGFFSIWQQKQSKGAGE